MGISVSVRPSVSLLTVCLSAVLSRLYLKGYSSDRFKISYSDSTWLEDMQRRVVIKKKEIVKNFPILKCVFESMCILSMRLLKGYSTDVQRRSFDWKKKLKLSKLPNSNNVWGLNAVSNFLCTFCPGCFSKTIHGIIFKLFIVILHIFKMCNVVVMLEKNIVKIVEFWNWLGLNAFSSNVHFVQAVSRRLFMGSFSNFISCFCITWRCAAL